MFVLYIEFVVLFVCNMRAQGITNQ